MQTFGIWPWVLPQCGIFTFLLVHYLQLQNLVFLLETLSDRHASQNHFPCGARIMKMEALLGAFGVVAGYYLTKGKLVSQTDIEMEFWIC